MFSRLLVHFAFLAYSCSERVTRRNGFFCSIAAIFLPTKNTEYFISFAMEKYESSSRLRSNQFPYHVTAASPNMSRNASISSSLQKRKDLRNHMDTPTTYMVVNFDERFVESVQSEVLPTVKVNEKRTKELLDKIRTNSPEKPDKLLSRAPRLASSYLLPRKIRSEDDRMMFRRADASTQTETNMNKMNFIGMTGYQTWTAEVVEPFLKELRKEIKAKRPQDINAYIIKYCQAMQKGEAPPETIDESQTN